MKVTHLTSAHDYTDTRIFLKECTSLANKGFNTSLIAPLAKEGLYNNVEIHSLNMDSKSRKERFLKSRKKILEMALDLKSDIYHFHDPDLLPVGMKLKKEGKEVIYDVHEDVPRQILNKHWISKYMRKYISQSFELYENHTVKNFDAIVAATPHIKKRFIQYNSNTINVNNYPILDELYENNQALNNGNIFSYIGGLTEERGSLAMAKAISKTNGELYLAGNFVNKEEEIKIKKLPSWINKISYLGYVDRERIKNILRESKAGLVVLEPKLNFIDSLPIKMFEYMCAGIPVIASNFPLWKKIIEENNCGICVNPLNINEIAEAIQWVIDNPQIAKEMGNNGRKAVNSKYNWKNESDKLIQLYEELC